MNAEDLKNILSYDPIGGDFLWLCDSGARKVKGNIAGHLQHGYRKIQILGKKYSAHRLAFLYMTGELPPNQVDHINHVKDDNRWVNLRLSTYSENSKNHPMQKNNTTGIVGVNRDKRKSLWKAMITVNGKSIYLGRRKSLFEATCLRKIAENKYGFHPNHGVGFA